MSIYDHVSFRYAFYFLGEKKVEANKYCINFSSTLLMIFVITYAHLTYAAPPGQPTLISPSGTIATATPTYTWRSVPTTLWYYLYVNDSTGNKIQRWYSPSEAGCASGTGNCSVTPSTVLANGSGMWWVLAWNPDGYGPWSNGMNFTVRVSTGPTFQWPVGSSPADITQGYAVYNTTANNSAGGYHFGLDIYSNNSRVVAANSGTVRTIPNGTYHNANHCMGNVIIIDHHNHTHSLYAHLAAISVTNGQSVQRGESIGTMGNTGSACKPFGVHLHFEVKTWNVMGSLHDDLGPVWGYTNPGMQTTNFPNWYGLMNSPTLSSP